MGGRGLTGSRVVTQILPLLRAEGPITHENRGEVSLRPPAWILPGLGEQFLVTDRVLSEDSPLLLIPEVYRVAVGSRGHEKSPC